MQQHNAPTAASPQQQGRHAPRSLSEIGVGRSARVEALGLEGLLRRRLLDLGFVPGVEVRVVRRSPLGDPTAYMVMGAVVALRASEAEAIWVR